MKKLGFAFAALAAALMMTGGSAEAAKKRAKVVVTPAPVYAPWWTAWNVRDPKVAAANTVVAGSATGAYFALRHNHHNVAHSSIRGTTGAFVAASAACAAVSPIVGTIVAQRPLTQREVFVSTANCVVPVVGGMAMNYWFDYYGWDQPKKAAKGKKR